MSEGKSINVRAIAMPITVVVSVVTCCVGVALYMAGGFSGTSHEIEKQGIKMDNGFDAIKTRLTAIEVRMEGGVTRRDLEEVLRLLFAKNTNLVPVELPR